MSNVKKALDELKDAMFNPSNQARDRLTNPYDGYTLGELREVLEELAEELDKIPPFAFNRIESINSEITYVTNAIDSLINQFGGDPDAYGN